MEKRFKGLLIASLALNGAYTLIASVVFFALGARPFGTWAGALCFLAVQAAMVLLMVAGQKLEVVTIALLGGYVLIIGKLLGMLDAVLLNVQLQSAVFPNGLSIGEYVSVQSLATTWLGSANPVVLLSAGLLLSACVARLCLRANGR